jgi:hypothetical protein
MLDEMVAMLEEIGDFLLQSLPLACGSFGFDGGRPATLHGRLPRGQFFADLGHGPQNRLGQFLDNVELADLMRHIAEHHLQRLGIKRRSIGRYAFQSPATLAEHCLKPTQEGRNVRMIRIVIQDLIEERLKVRLSTIDSTQNGPSYNSSAAM